MGTTVIRNAAWVIAFDAATGRHAYRRDVDVAFEGNTLVHVGPAWAGPADAEIDGRRGMNPRFAACARSTACAAST